MSFRSFFNRYRLIGPIRRFQGRGVMLAGLAGLCVLITWSTMSEVRTISIQATTLGGGLTFQGQLNDWAFEKATVCRLLSQPDFRTIDSDSEDVCARSLYETETIEDTVIEWGSNSSIRFKGSKEGEFVIQTLDSNTPGLPEGTLIVISPSVWAGHGALTFQGIAQLGAEISSGSKDYLLEGSWEAHQSGFATSFLRDVTEVVKSGSFIRGATVDLVSDTSDVLSYGHITPVGTDEAGVKIALLSERGPVAIRVKLYGLSKPAVFRPDWIDTLSSSPMLIALAVLFSFLLASIQIVSIVPARRKNEQ